MLLNFHQILENLFLLRGFIALQGKHLLVEVFSVTKFGKIFKKTFSTTYSIDCGALNGCSI
jgi:hypothetical protein